MCVCVYIYIDIYMCVCIYIYIYVYINIADIPPLGEPLFEFNCSIVERVHINVGIHPLIAFHLLSPLQQRRLISQRRRLIYIYMYMYMNVCVCVCVCVCVFVCVCTYSG